MNNAKYVALAAAFGILLAGCSSTPTKTQEEQKAPATTQTPKTTMQENTRVMPTSVPEYLDPNSPISKNRSVYFDFDDYSVKKEYAALVELQGKYLASRPTLAVKIEGNADERGSSEYNLALGQKRAEAVLRALKAFGVKDAQLEAVSFGKEKPKALGHDEAAWSQNRRADIQYPSK